MRSCPFSALKENDLLFHHLAKQMRHRNISGEISWSFAPGSDSQETCWGETRCASRETNNQARAELFRNQG